MPRLPTMRVIGSHDMSTSVRFLVSGSWTVAIRLPRSVAGGPVAGRQVATAMPPPGLLVDRVVGEAAQGLHQGAVGARDARRELAPGRRVHEGHELVREARHRAADAD